MRVILVSRFVTLTRAPGTDAPDESLTVPTIFAVGSCANEATAKSRHTDKVSAAIDHRKHVPLEVFTTSTSPFFKSE